MRVLRLLHKTLSAQSLKMHGKRLTALLSGVDSLLRWATLTVTGLGRGLQSLALTKHNIKRMDRLLSNTRLQSERMGIYKAIAHYLCRSNPRPIILVDWSDLIERERLMLLRAAIAVEGRSIPIYEAVYTLKQYNSPRIHMRFLEELKSLLPEGCSPIVITDAGFRGPWFKAVEALDWHWVGRIRNSIKYRLLSRKCWRYTTDLYYRANKNPTYLGPAELSHKRPYLCHLHLFKKGRSKRQTCRSVEHYRKHSSSTVFKKQQRDPWLIATNLNPEEFSSKRIVALYGKRMQIEECFRDLKSDKYGFGITVSRSKNIERLNLLLLIGALATICLWWVGCHAQRLRWHRHFQANTVSDRNVLSILFLAAAVLRRHDYKINDTELIESWRSFPDYVLQRNFA